MLKQWLKVTERKPCPYVFTIVDVSERQSPNPKLKKYLAKHVVSSYRNLSYLKFIFKSKPQRDLEDYIKNSVLASTKGQIGKNVAQGDFGEILAELVATYFYGLEVPLKKLRWKFNKDRSTFCTDMIAHNKGANIADVYYYEVKTRLRIRKETVNGVSGHVTVNAHNALLKDQQASFSAIADFLSRLYYEIGLYDKAKTYNDLAANPLGYSNHYELFFVINRPSFMTQILDDLHNLPPSLAPLKVTVVLVEDLGRIILETQKLAQSVSFQG